MLDVLKLDMMDCFAPMNGRFHRKYSTLRTRLALAPLKGRPMGLLLAAVMLNVW